MTHKLSNDALEAAAKRAEEWDVALDGPVETNWLSLRTPDRELFTDNIAYLQPLSELAPFG